MKPAYHVWSLLILWLAWTNVLLGSVINEEDNAANTDCGTASTVSAHRYKCTFGSYLSANILEREYEITFGSMTSSDKISSIASLDNAFSQFVYVSIIASSGDNDYLTISLRKTCDFVLIEDSTNDNYVSTDTNDGTKNKKKNSTSTNSNNNENNNDNNDGGISSNQGLYYSNSIEFDSYYNKKDGTTIYTTILPSCDDSEYQLCTYYVVIQASDDAIDMFEAKNNTKIEYEMRQQLGILLSFQHDKYQYTDTTQTTNENSNNNNNNNDDGVTAYFRSFFSQSYKSYTELTASLNTYIVGYYTASSNNDGNSGNNDNSNSNSNDISQNATCNYIQLYGVEPSSSDFAVGLIVQPESEALSEDYSLTITQYTSDASSVTNTRTAETTRGSAITVTYDRPSSWNSGDYLLFEINSNDKSYQIYTEPNMSAIQEIVMNGAGWVLFISLIILISIAMCRRFCPCLNNNNMSNSDGNFVLEMHQFLQMQFNLMAMGSNNNNNNGFDNDLASDASDLSGADSEELTQLPIIEYTSQHRKLSRKDKNYRYKSCVICMENYHVGDCLRVLECSHGFHAKCVDPWLKTQISKKRCPLCKQQMGNAINVYDTKDSHNNKTRQSRNNRNNRQTNNNSNGINNGNDGNSGNNSNNVVTGATTAPAIIPIVSNSAESNNNNNHNSSNAINESNINRISSILAPNSVMSKAMSLSDGNQTDFNNNNNNNNNNRISMKNRKYDNQHTRHRNRNKKNNSRRYQSNNVETNEDTDFGTNTKTQNRDGTNRYMRNSNNRALLGSKQFHSDHDSNGTRVTNKNKKELNSNDKSRDYRARERKDFLDSRSDSALNASNGQHIGLRNRKLSSLPQPKTKMKSKTKSLTLPMSQDNGYTNKSKSLSMSPARTAIKTNKKTSKKEFELDSQNNKNNKNNNNNNGNIYFHNIENPFESLMKDDEKTHETLTNEMNEETNGKHGMQDGMQHVTQVGFGFESDDGYCTCSCSSSDNESDSNESDDSCSESSCDSQASDAKFIENVKNNKKEKIKTKKENEIEMIESSPKKQNEQNEQNDQSENVGGNHYIFVINQTNVKEEASLRRTRMGHERSGSASQTPSHTAQTQTTQTNTLSTFASAKSHQTIASQSTFCSLTNNSNTSRHGNHHSQHSQHSQHSNNNDNHTQMHGNTNDYTSDENFGCPHCGDSQSTCQHCLSPFSSNRFEKGLESDFLDLDNAKYNHSSHSSHSIGDNNSTNSSNTTVNNSNNLTKQSNIGKDNPFITVGNELGNSSFHQTYAIQFNTLSYPSYPMTNNALNYQRQLGRLQSDNEHLRGNSLSISQSCSISGSASPAQLNKQHGSNLNHNNNNNNNLNANYNSHHSHNSHNSHNSHTANVIQSPLVANVRSRLTNNHSMSLSKSKSLDSSLENNNIIDSKSSDKHNLNNNNNNDNATTDTRINSQSYWAIDENLKKV